MLCGCIASCGDPDAKAPDAGMPIDGAVDAAIDADEGMGFRVNVQITGVRDPMTFTLREGAAAQRVVATEDVAADPLLRFPRRLADGAAFDVTRTPGQACMPDAFSGKTIAGADVTLATTCDGVLDLRSLTAAEPIRLTPRFDPQIATYTAAKTPFLLDPSAAFGLTATAAYGAPTMATTTPPSPLPSGVVTVAVSHPAFPTPRTYSFPLAQELAQEALIKAATPIANALLGGVQLRNNGLVGGHSVAISGDTMVAGAPGGTAAVVGTVTVYTRTGATWKPQASLTPNPPPTSGWRYGHAVAIEGDTVVIGAPGSLGSTGAAYLFRRTGTTWAQIALTQPALATDAGFGSAVAIAGGEVLISAPGAESPIASVGKVYSYPSTGGASTTTLSAATGGDRFGSAIAISGTRLAIGAPFASANGATVIYTKSGGTWGSPITLAGASANSRFGAAIGLEASLIAIGAPNAGSAAGEVRVYRYNGTTWVGPEVKVSSSPTALEEYGFAVAVRGTTVLVGAPSFSATPGWVYLYRCATTCSAAPDASVTEAVPKNGDRFGTSIAVDRVTLVVGAPYDDAGASDSGAVYVFR